MLKLLTGLVAALLFLPAIAQSEFEYSKEQLEEDISKHMQDFNEMTACNPYFPEYEGIATVKFPITCVGKRISSVDVILQGEAAKTLEKDDIRSYIKLRARNDLSFLEQDFITLDEAFKEGVNYYPNALNEQFINEGIIVPLNPVSLSRLAINCYVWTVGTGYPVARHTECRIVSMIYNDRLISVGERDYLEQSMLGYSSQDNLLSSVKGSIERIISDIATQWIEEEQATQKYLKFRNESLSTQ